MTKGSMDLKHEDPDHERVPYLCSKRWILAYVGMGGFFFVYSLRVNMSVAIVCMVKDEITNSTENETLSGSCSLDTKNETNTHAEFDWDKSTQGFLLSSFFYGYIVTQIPGGWLAGRYGGKRVLGLGVLLTAIATMVIPVAARWDYRAVMALRIFMGIAEGVSFPAMHAMWGRWAPPPERTSLTSFTYMGLNIGNIVTYIVSGVLCDYGFDNGWGSIFYITGGAAFIWVALWFFLVADTPETHPTISDAEINYILSTRGKQGKKESHGTESKDPGLVQHAKEEPKFKVPWLAVVKSRAMWVCLCAHICNNWMHYTLLTGLPTFMKEVLKFDIKQNGLLSSIPYIVMVFTMVLGGQFADFLRKRWLSTTYTRRIFQAVSFIGSGACLVAVGFIDCEHRIAAVVLLAVAVGFEGLLYSGYMVNQVDFAPRYAGLLLGMTNCIATVPGMIAPSVIGALTPNKTQEEWRNVFYICGALTLFGTIVFGGFASGEVEPWAASSEEMEIDVDPPEKPEQVKVAEHGAHNNHAYTDTETSEHKLSTD